MNKIVYLLIATTSTFVTAQSFEMGAGAGTGFYYIFEEADNSVMNTYEAPASLYVDVKYNFKDRIDGLKLRFQNTSVNVVGLEYQTNEPINAIVETFTTSLVYERLRSDKIFNIGYQGGMGLTKQELEFKRNPFSQRQNGFVSIHAGGIFSFRLQEKLRLNVETGFLWTDPINTFRGSEYWKTAGEDLSLLLQLGVTYRFSFD